jgi:hypothetical protein
VAFESPDLDLEEAALIRERLEGADSPDAVKRAFDVPPPGADLSPEERALYEALTPILARYGRDAVAAVLAGEPFDDAALAAELQAAMTAALASVVAGRALALAAEIGPDLDEAAAAALGAQYARERVALRVAGISETTRKVVQKTVDLYRQTPGMTRGQLEAVLRQGFSQRRAESIAITETTNADSAATVYTQGWLRERGLVFVRVWRTSGDEKECSICSPLNGTTEEAWKDRYPDGPAAHTRCRCFITLQPVEEALAS